MKKLMSIAAVALFVAGSTAFACDTCGCKDKKASCSAEKKCADCTAEKTCAACTAKKAEAKKAEAKK